MPERTVNSAGARFGFNGQEKVNEISGVGNHNTALFWEYDTRIGRRWNLDPVDQVSISNYAVNGLNPIMMNDPLGNQPKKGDHKYKSVPRKYEKKLPGFPKSFRLKYKNGARASWSLGRGKHGEWDSENGEIEVYDKSKTWLGAYDPETGEKIKDPRKSRNPTYNSVALDRLKEKTSKTTEPSPLNHLPNEVFENGSLPNWNPAPILPPSLQPWNSPIRIPQIPNPSGPKLRTDPIPIPMPNIRLPSMIPLIPNERLLELILSPGLPPRLNPEML